ncbi:MAG TPA: PEGA domain-containing protein [Labilithrix sp.]|nr:PEGA domain-containing protein [Labilithrix sp.]
MTAAIVLGVLAEAPVARADAEADAKDLFARARDLRTKNDCASAVPLFRKAYKVYPNGLGSLRNVAECEEQLGHYASSKRAWLDIKRALITMSQDPKYDGWDKDAQDAATRLQPKVATVFVDVVVKSPAGEGPANDRSGVEIFINGESVGTNLVGTPLERDPGNYRVRVAAPYATPVEQEVALTAGDAKHVTLRLVQTPPEKVATTPGEGSDVIVDTGKGKRTAGIVLIGVGAAALIGSGITFLIRNGAESDLDAQCPGHQGCSPALKDTVDKGELMSTLTTILFPVGLVAAGAGVGLYVWGTNSREPAPTSGSLKVTPGLGRVDATWRF